MFARRMCSAAAAAADTAASSTTATLYSRGDYAARLHLLAPEHWTLIDEVAADTGATPTRAMRAVYARVAAAHGRIDARATEEAALRWAGCTSAEDRALVRRRKEVRARSVGQLWVPDAWAFDETARIEAEACAPAPQQEVGAAFQFLASSADVQERFSHYALLEPDLQVLQKDLWYQEQLAHVTALKRELLAPGGPDPSVVTPAAFQQASLAVENSAQHKLYCAHVVAFRMPLL